MTRRVNQVQRGFAAIAAIFLVVVLAALGGFMLTFSNTQQLTSAQDVQGSRAYWAARAGLEWGVSAVSATGVCTTSPALLAVDGFTVCVACRQHIYTEAADTPNVSIFTMESVARASVLASCTAVGAVGSVSYIERSISLSMEL